MAKIRTPKMLIRVCDKCRCELGVTTELSSAAPLISVKTLNTVTLFDLCNDCCHKVFENLGTGRKIQS